SWNIIAMVLMAYIFGWLVGAGLPPTATYIIGAVVIVRPLQELGINPWVAHFFVFLLSVWGELSPPTSLAAAVTSRIAEASFMRTMWEALKICAPITLMTFAIFTRSDMVVNPGWLQAGAAFLVLIGTSGVAFAMFGRFLDNKGGDIMLRGMLALFSLVTLLHPNDMTATAVGAVVLVATLIGIWRHRLIAAPKSAPPPESAERLAPAGDLAPILTEARRDIG
ncbi:MAG TPA: TRAP transporter large permease subunit, partial [Xanthobacteraceae bacterium]|nr:TRAP transporter large permease subunit [Xanthobacteraceae bacterium]